MHVDPTEITDGALSPTRLDNPLHRSGLALAGANDFLESSRSHPRFGLGLLLAANIAELDLRRVELLFLSACETGRGAKRVGEGIAGLQQAFLASGVQALVVSIWSIPDMVTCLLVAEFYRRLGEGQTIERALTLAQTYVRELTAQQYDDEVRTLSKRYGVNPSGSLSYEAPTKRPFEHPSCWGGFRCVGDTGRSIALRRSN
jgi:CHAT domain-containing protein